MSIIKISEATREVHEYLDVSKECKFFTVKAHTRICYSQTFCFPELHYEEAWDTDLNFFMDGKQVNYKGFKDLYEKLYGEKTFGDFEMNLVEELEEVACLHHRKKYKTIENLDKNELDSYINNMITNNLVNKRTEVCKKTNKKYLYTSNYLLRRLCKKAGKYAIQKLVVPYTYKYTTSPKIIEYNEHEVVVLHEYL